ncbi:hypothetical protein [Thalassotalea piscium]|uniref:Uncharacterized protein n=1 Tax=Thalassotalea piscium TaxID=1230533 RepID=A0A7X0NH44_9GAMM|nr:hypothetical protein [Thalassotalea piscium]MBB6543357.1 hypothetical protein [Thalassotalea piscium]
MNKREWEQIKFNFAIEYNRTGVSVLSWCKENQLNYDTARRHLKIKNAKLLNFTPSELKKRKRRRGPPLGSQNALKHGGYSNIFCNITNQKVVAITEEDELCLSRIRIHKAMQAINKLQEKLQTNIRVETCIKLMNALFLVEQSIDRCIGKIELIKRTSSKTRIEKQRNYDLNHNSQLQQT